MKKILLVFLNFILIFYITGCSKKAEGKTSSGFEMKSAQIVVENYLKYSIKKDDNNARKLLGKELEKSLKFDPNLDIWGYMFDEITQVGNSGMLKIKVLKGSSDKPYSLLEEYNIKVEKTDGDYKISEIVKKPEKEVFLEKNVLRIKDKDQAEAKLLLYKGSIPRYAASKDNKANSYDMKVSLSSFGPIAVSYTGEKAVFSTDYMGNCYFALAYIEDTKETAAAGQEEKKPEEGKNENVEKPITKKLINLDYLLNSKLLRISFTPDEKFIIAEYKEKEGTSLRIYFSSSGELIPYKFEDDFSSDKYNVSFFFSDKKYIYFSVSVINNEPDAKAGSYRLKMEDFKIERI